MRIGIEMMAVQSPGSRGRGVGRYARQLVEAILRSKHEHAFRLYAHANLPGDEIPEGRDAEVLALPERGTPGDALREISDGNRDGLDWLVTLNPFEQVPGFNPPPRLPGSPRLAAVVYDLIPFVYPERYLSDPNHASWMYRRLRTLRHYDLILAISESTRRDCPRWLGLPKERVRTIGGAVSPGVFRPVDRDEPMPEGVRIELGKRGIQKPYVFCLGGEDWRKNLPGLVEGFARMSEEVRRSHQLVVACHLSEGFGRHLHHVAERTGIAGQLVLTGAVPEPTLVRLYQHCGLFVFPSFYEGLGLPLLEAMQCGAAVVAGRNSSQPEVVGEAGLLVDAADLGALSSGMERVLEDPELRRELGRRGVERVKAFTWERTGQAAVEAIETSRGGPVRMRGGRRRGRLAIFSPWPPKASGVSDYAARLVGDLERDYAIDLYHEPGYVPEPALGDAGIAAFDYRLFERNAAARGYRGVLHQMGNSFYHLFVHEAMGRHRGIVTLHDFNLAGFHWWRANTHGDGLGTFGAEVAYAEPARRGEIVPKLADWAKERGGMQEAFTRRRLYLNRRVFEEAEAVVVHSPWCLRHVEREWPELAEKVVVIRHGATPAAVDLGQRRMTRERFGLPHEALVIGCFGILSQSKMNVEAIEVFAAMRGEMPGAILMFVGQDWENGQARERAARLGLGESVRFLGRQDDEAFVELLSAVDMAFSLRRPPTYGETSGALLHLLRHGIASIVTDTDTFADYPDDVVRKVRWEEEGHAGLAVALMELASSPGRRERLGRAARAYVAANHTWTQSAAEYAALIERVAEQHERRARDAGGVTVNGMGTDPKQGLWMRRATG